MKQTEMIVQYMKEHGGITQLDATNDLGCTRLAARISDIKHLGYPIVTVMMTGKDRFGKPTHYAKYFLEA